MAAPGLYLARVALDTDLGTFGTDPYHRRRLLSECGHS